MILLLPASGDEPPPRVTLFEAAAALAVIGRDVGSICERQPTACQTGERALSLFGRKLETGTRIVTDQWSSGEEGSVEATNGDHGTLTDEDRAAPWTMTETR